MGVSIHFVAKVLEGKGNEMAPSLFFIDWISVVFGFDLFEREGGVVPLVSDVARKFVSFGFSPNWVVCKPRFGYELAWRHGDTGVVVQTTIRRPNMGVNLVATGQALQACGWDGLLERCCRADGRFTRVDLTMDVLDSGFDLESLYNDAANGNVVTRAKRHSIVKSATGSTMYVGGRSSERFLRIYDKGGEQGGEQGERFRIELECKGNAANFAAYAINDRELTDAREVIMGYFDAPSHDGWSRAMEGVEYARNMSSEKKRPNTEAWLMEFVADQVAKAEEREAGFLDKFVNEIRRMLINQ